MRSLNFFLKSLIPIIFTIQISMFMICADVSAAVSSSESAPDIPAWNSIESNFFVIYYHPAANLKRIERELNRRPIYFDQAARYGETTVSQEICYRLDKLFNRVKEILNMYPKIQKVSIKIFKNRSELNEEYLKIFGKQGDLSSFYIDKYNTIYTSESDITDSVMIHEMAHVIVDSYFSVIPPESVGEILASYVDVHLEK